MGCFAVHGGLIGGVHSGIVAVAESVSLTAGFGLFECASG